jgi:hypothetical protein
VRKPRTVAATAPAAPAKVAKPRAKAAPAPKPATKRATTRRKTGATTPARAAKAVKAAVTEVADGGSSRKKVVIGVAAIAGVAAGVAAIYGRKKLVEASTEALEAVTGSARESGPTMSAD